MTTSNNEHHELILLSESPYDTPNPNKALQDPEGLSAIGGDLSSKRLIHLYSKGFFPWFSDPDPILWWHPERRCILKPECFHESKSMKKILKKEPWFFSINKEFESVISHCSALRADKEGTWISNDIISAYTELHKLGYAHSIEVWQKEKLVGGLYGIAIDNLFFGESMFSLTPNASKVALKALCNLSKDCHIKLIDCQVESEHLLSLGAEPLPRKVFLSTLEKLILNIKENTNLLDMSKGTPKRII